MESYRLLSTRDDAVLSLFFVSVGGYCQEDWFPETRLPQQLSTSPQMLVVDAMRLSPTCFVTLHRSFVASGHDPHLRLTDVAWRLQGDVFRITGDIIWRTNDLLPLSVHYALGEHQPEWDRNWFRSYVRRAPFAAHFASHRVRWGRLHDNQAYDIGHPPHSITNELVAEGTTVRPCFGTDCDRVLWNCSDCHICDLWEGLNHPQLIEMMAQYWSCLRP